MSKKASFPRPAGEVVSTRRRQEIQRTFVDFTVNIGQVYRQLGSLPGDSSISLRLYRVVDVENETYYHIVEEGGIDDRDALYFRFQTLKS
jgi:hypothetical protein